MALSAAHEVLQFLADQNPQARQLAMSMAVSFSAKGHPDRHLLTDKLLDANGEPVKMWNGEPLDVIEQLKRLCRDQPVCIAYIDHSVDGP